MALRYGESVDLGGASAVGMVWRAAAAIERGMCSALPVPHRGAPLAHPTGGGPTRWAIDRSGYREFEVPYGNIGATEGYALIAQRYEHEYGDTSVLLAILLIGGVSNAAGCGGKSSPSTIYSPPVGGYATYTPPTDSYVAPTFDPQPAVEQPAAAETTAPDLDVNVPNPTVPDGVVPGDTAICRDGHIYHGQHRGACSHHHGVAQWL